MPALPWAGSQPIDPGREYLVMASRLPLKSFRWLPGFMRDTMAIRRQLAGAAGLVGYTLDAELARRTFWTFSVWEDQASLDAFAAGEPHRQIMRRLAPRMGQTRFEFVRVMGSELPMSWDRIKRLLSPGPSA